MRLTTNQPETAEPVMKPEVAAMIESWRPRFPRPADVADVEVVLPTVQKWVAATVPQTPGTAALLMRKTTDYALWGWRTTGCLREDVLLIPDNVEHYIHVVHEKLPGGWKNNTRTILRRVARAVNPDDWPLKPWASEAGSPSRHTRPARNRPSLLSLHCPDGGIGWLALRLCASRWARACPPPRPAWPGQKTCGRCPVGVSLCLSAGNSPVSCQSAATTPRWRVRRLMWHTRAGLTGSSMATLTSPARPRTGCLATAALTPTLRRSPSGVPATPGC